MNISRGRARLGLLVPFTNTNFEPDMALMCPPDISLYAARLGGYDENEIPDADQMAGLGLSELDEPLRLLAGAKPDVVLYGCTSATLTHGLHFDRALANRIQVASGAKAVTAAGALVTALQALKAKRIGFASPYTADINDLAVAFLTACGFEIVARAEMPSALSNDEQGAMTPDDVAELALKADHADADAMVLSCTDMRSVETIERLETQMGKPVVTSNQALAFQAFRMLNVHQPVTGFGQLLERPRL